MSNIYSRLLYIEKALTSGQLQEILSQWKTGTKISIYSSNKQIINYIKANVGANYFNFSVGIVKDSIGEEFEIINGEKIEEYRMQLEQLDRNSSFNIGQYEVEHSSEGNIILRAGAGTGKTYSMISRIHYLIWLQNYTPDQLKEAIVMITFTNDAADSMKEKLKKSFLDYYKLTRDIQYLEFIDVVNDMQISTIDSLARRLVKKHSSYLGLGVDFKITTDYQKRKILHSQLDNFVRNAENEQMLEELLELPLYKVENRLNKLMEIMGDKKISLLDPDTKYYTKEEYMDRKTRLIREVLKNAEKEFTKWSIENNTIALSDLVKKVEHLIDQSESFKAQDWPRVETVFVDEFQDTDDVQIELISKFKQILRFDLFVVGDIKQCIYRFRGAEDNAFEQLKKYSGTFKTLGLTKNYRTDQKILEKYNDIFNKWGKYSYLTYNLTDKNIDTIIGTKSINSTLEIHSYQYLFKESKTWGEKQEYMEEGLRKVLPEVIRKAEQNILDSKQEEGTIALLVRYNAEVNKIKEICESVGITVETPIGGELFKLDPAIDLYKLVMALKHSNEAQYLFNLYSTAYIAADLNKKNIYETTHNNKESVDYFYQNIPIPNWGEYLNMLRQAPILKVIKKVIDDTKPWDRYASKKRDKIESDNMQQNQDAEYFKQHYRYNLEKVLECLVEYANTDYLTLNKVIDYMKIMITTRQEREARKSFNSVNGIKILCTTVHRAKGLEYDTVILPFTNIDIEGSMNKGDADIIYKEHKLGYRIKKGRDNEHIYNAFYKEFKGDEKLDRSREEARILYVALTRVIRRLIYIFGQEEDHQHKVISNKRIEWKNMIRGELECK